MKNERERPWWVEILRELVPHILWDGIKHTTKIIIEIGLTATLATIVIFLRHHPIALGIFAGCAAGFLLVRVGIVVGRREKSKAGAQPEDHAAESASPTTGATQDHGLYLQIERLKAENKQLKGENTKIKEENAKTTQQVANLTELRLQILGLLGLQSAPLFSILKDLSVKDEQGRREVLAILGQLVDQNKIEADTSMPKGYYRLVKEIPKTT